MLSVALAANVSGKKVTMIVDEEENCSVERLGISN